LFKDYTSELDIPVLRPKLNAALEIATATTTAKAVTALPKCN
jgi:hypothetical protein